MSAFIDASVILAALGSQSGGSAWVLKLIRKRKLKAVTSQAVVEEVFNNIHKIGVSEAKTAQFILTSQIKLVPAPESVDVERYFGRVADKDAHVIASAVKSGAETIITLDKKHLLSAKIKGLEIITPGEFLGKPET